MAKSRKKTTRPEQNEQPAPENPSTGSEKDGGESRFQNRVENDAPQDKTDERFMTRHDRRNPRSSGLWGYKDWEAAEGEKPEGDGNGKEGK